MRMLPYPDKPLLLSYHNKAFPFGIIQANSQEDITKWLCTKCVNCVYYPNSPKNKFNLAVVDVWGVNEQLVVQQVLQIKKDFFSLFKMDLLHILKTAISNGCYVHGNYNEKYIPGKWAYGNEDYMHDFLLIGCDDDTFISVGYVADGHFKKYTIPNQNLIESLYEVGGVKININLFSYEDGAVPSPNVQRMVNDLKKYISTSNCFENTNPSSNSYGIATNIRLKEFFLDEVKNKGEIYVDKRYSRVLLEHKWVMNQLVNLFLDAHEKVEFQKYTNQNYKKAEIVHMLGLKMSSNGQVDLINRIAQLIDEMIASELEYIPVLIRILEEKYQDADCKMKLQ